MKGRQGMFKRTKGRPLLVAGPCSAETESQVLDTARQIARHADVFRAGLWKPRTRPGDFEGVGTKGLPWLEKVQQELGMPVATEVANASHVEHCLKYGIDALWIGARTSGNPFSVQEIADAIKGTGIPVMIKNPTSPDAKLWLGAVERVVKAGSSQVIAVHRGVSGRKATKGRNAPRREVVIEMRTMMPDLQMLCDPSHICGSTSGIQQIAQKSLDLSFDGLMVEVHDDPDKAMSDADQQLTPMELNELLNHLVLRHSTGDPGIMAVLDSMREFIDTLDGELIRLLGQRMRTVERIAEHKRDNRLTIFQQGRWEEIMRSRADQAYNEGLNTRFIEQLFSTIHQESITNQTRVMNEGGLKQINSRGRSCTST